MKIKASTPKGMRDFGSAELKKRNYIFNTIKQVFEKYGYQPIETPTMENLETLTGKYGEEGDKLLFKVLNSGDYLSKADKKALSELDSSTLSRSISEKGLRYDLTIPFARYVVQHQNELTFPFKRYQIQPVWRADRPQKGRYREFYQCDADVIGSKGLLNEVELILIYDEVFKKLGLDVEIKFNHRRALYRVAELAEEDLHDRMEEYQKSPEADSANKRAIAHTTVSLRALKEMIPIIDKHDKIGTEKVLSEISQKFGNRTSMRISKFLNFSGSVEETITFYKKIILSEQKSDKGREYVMDTISQIERIASYVSGRMQNVLTFDLKLARGLDYYTGTIFEVVAKDAKMGSIGGGGRYDDLTGIFGLQNMSGVGISFGVERIYDVMEELGLFNQLDLNTSTTKILFLNFGGEAERVAFKYVQQIREKGIAAEIFPSNDKFKKQMKYADQKQIPFVAFIGEEEVKTGQIPVKIMTTGDQQPYTFDQVLDLLQHD